MKITLRNDFHNRSATIVVPASGIVSHPVVRATWRRLCGNKGCCCGGLLGQRGTQTLPDGRKLIFNQVNESSLSTKIIAAYF